MIEFLLLFLIFTESSYYNFEHSHGLGNVTIVMEHAVLHKRKSTKPEQESCLSLQLSLKESLRIVLEENKPCNKKLKLLGKSFLACDGSLVEKVKIASEAAETAAKCVCKDFRSMEQEELRAENNLLLFFNLSELVYLLLTNTKNWFEEIEVFEKRITDCFKNLAVFFRRSKLVIDSEFGVTGPNFSENTTNRLSPSVLFLDICHMFSLHSSMLNLLARIGKLNVFSDMLKKQKFFFASLFQKLDAFYKTFLFQNGTKERDESLYALYFSVRTTTAKIHEMTVQLSDELCLDNEDNESKVSKKSGSNSGCFRSVFGLCLCGRES